MDAVETLELILDAEATLTGLLKLVAATQPVSDIIGKHIAAGDNTWTDDERNVITDALNAAKAEADAKITAAGG